MKAIIAFIRDYYHLVRYGWVLRPFKPCVIYNSEMKVTEMVLEDTSIVWVPWGPFKGHAIDCGYDRAGKLVGIKIWDDVRERPIRSRGL